MQAVQVVPSSFFLCSSIENLAQLQTSEPSERSVAAAQSLRALDCRAVCMHRARINALHHASLQRPPRLAEVCARDDADDHDLDADENRRRALLPLANVSEMLGMHVL